MKKKYKHNFFLFYLVVVGMFLMGTFAGNQVVSVIAENKPIIRVHTVVLDPGHGGEDGGAISCTGKPEATYNLNISLKLRDLLHLIGYRTIITRETDTAIYSRGNTIAEKKASDLKERVKLANKDNNAILISIHQNQFPEAKYSGAQVFYANSEASKQLASEMQNTLVQSLNPGSNRKEKRGEGIFLLEKVSCPAILIECGFLSNPAEEAKLSNPEYQRHLACVIASVAAGNLSNA